MKDQRISKVLCTLLFSLSLGLSANAAEASSAATTLENLQAAYNGESNAKARYDAFAVKADEEGYKGVASLFRAAAKAEEVHASKYSTIIKKLKAVPTANIEQPVVKTTKENLQAAIKGETYEKNTMYPLFIKQAELDKNKKAIIAFKGAMAAETEHAKLYQQALNNMNSWKDAKVFIVCPVCGYTTINLDIKKCPVCSEPRSKFYTIK